jgi:fused signal recognition particle receptor
MFSFLKRFRGSKASDNAPAESPDTAEAAAQDAPAEAPVADAPAAEARDNPAAEGRDNITQPSTQQPVHALAPRAAPIPPAAPPAAPAFVPASVEPAAPARAGSQSQAHHQTQSPTPFQSAPPVAREPQPSSLSAPEPEAPEAFETVEIIPPPAPEPAAKRSWLTRLKSGLSKTSSSITGIFVGTKIDEDLYEELETALLMSDAGVDATEFLLETLREKVRAERLADPQQVKTALRELLIGLLKPLEKSLMLGRDQPLVMMIAGVNGAGKTTSIGKLAKHLQRFDQSVLLAAGDTFRAAAREQLTIWGERNNVTVVSQESGDPAAVIFDAVGAARARKIDVLMADTAGRLPTQLHLMEELRKVKRVIGKALDGAPHEVLLVIDANTGQNALAQVKAFDDALGLTGLIVTKLDGTAKGGILAAIARQRPVPVYFIGVGEKVDDLQPFSAEEFSDALLGN